MSPPRKYTLTPGAHFGRLTVLQEDHVYRGDSHTERAALCTCACNNIVTVELSKLFSGNTASCGCLHRESIAKIGRSPSGITHGLWRHPLYSTYCGMIDRCHNKQSNAYKWYGGRGIAVCSRWHNVQLFIEDIEREIGPRPPRFSLDRINNDGNYEPGNVRWATASEQALNRRQNQQRDARGRWIGEQLAMRR